MGSSTLAGTGPRGVGGTQAVAQRVAAAAELRGVGLTGRWHTAVALGGEINQIVT